MITDIKIIKDIFPKNINLQICEYLANQCSWSLAYENDPPYELIKNNKHLGFSFCTFNDFKFIQDSFLHQHAYIVFCHILEKLNLKGTLMRSMWNMYLTNQSSSLHKDKNEDNYISALYSLHETDGGIEIGNQFFKDQIGELKVFKSNILHKGIGPKQSIARFNLNLVIELK